MNDRIIKPGIKSFVLRAGRMSPRQEKALIEDLKDYEIKEQDIPWDFSAIFSREAPTIVEIGFGMGASLLEMASLKPELNFIGIEVHRPGVGSLVAGLKERGLTNLRVVMDDAVEVLRKKIAPNSLAGIQIFFPDPWPKKRHHKRRLIQAEFVELLTQVLKPGGFIHAATDWEDYASSMREVFSANPVLVESESKLVTGGRPLTKFEARGLTLGHGIWDLIYIASPT